MTPTPANRAVEAARSAAQVLRQRAADVDRRNRFPTESVDALASTRLLTFFVPTDLDGFGGDFRTFCDVARMLGEQCSSTAMIWAMHSQQVLAMADHARATHATVLKDVVDNGSLVASCTTEPAKGGDLLRADAALVAEGGRLRVRRVAPVVSYGAEAKYFLITMRAGPDEPRTDVRLVLVQRGDGAISVDGDWKAMGMRGTRSIPMTFDVVVDADRIVGGPFREIALQSVVPAGQLGWTAAWLGAAQGAYRRSVARLRANRGQRERLTSDALASGLARVRLLLDLVEALLYRTADRVDAMRARDASVADYEDTAHNIGLNGVKIAGSEMTFEAVNLLIEIVGLRGGYLEDDETQLERVWRDLRSASLMYSNQRLLEANGKLSLVEGSKLGQLTW